eukprot:800293-Alexandrium_andersonii.AAC.1
MDQSTPSPRLKPGAEWQTPRAFKASVFGHGEKLSRPRPSPTMACIEEPGAHPPHKSPMPNQR